MNKPLLFLSCLCRPIILISLKFWPVVKVVSGGWGGGEAFYVHKQS